MLCDCGIADDSDSDCFGDDAFVDGDGDDDDGSGGGDQNDSTAVAVNDADDGRENNIQTNRKTDGWTSRANEPYQALTLHYITKSFELERFVVDCKSFQGRHTAQQVANLLDTMILSIPGLKDETKKVVVTDSGIKLVFRSDIK